MTHVREACFYSSLWVSPHFDVNQFSLNFFTSCLVIRNISAYPTSFLFLNSPLFTLCSLIFLYALLSFSWVQLFSVKVLRTSCIVSHSFTDSWSKSLTFSYVLFTSSCRLFLVPKSKFSENYFYYVWTLCFWLFSDVDSYFPPIGYDHMEMSSAWEYFLPLWLSFNTFW